tara:strand:+ start:1454 stop:1822 length:369 start_codon:yes stop_codon:yes gene_type:complete
MKNIDPYITFNGLNIRFDRFITLFYDQAPYSVKQIPFKRDLRFWNDSPWSMQPVKAVHVTAWSREGTIDKGVYQIWERKDGMGMKVEWFETIEEYKEYSPSQDAPHNIKNELGLCENYHTGI